MLSKDDLVKRLNSNGEKRLEVICKKIENSKDSMNSCMHFATYGHFCANLSNSNDRF